VRSSGRLARRCGSVEGPLASTGAPIVATDSGRERLDRSRCLLAAMLDRVNFPRIADVDSWIALKDHQIRKLAGSQHSAIIELQQRRRIGGSVGNRLHRREAGFNHQREFQMLGHSRNAQAYAGV
jgi:hypothetical protein